MSLSALGQVDTSVTADHPLHAVFSKNGTRTYVATNLSDASRTVRFSDGTTLVVEPGKTATTGAHTWSGGNAVPGEPNPPVASPTLRLVSPSSLTTAGGDGAREDTITAAGGGNHDGTPTDARVYTTCGITGTHDPSRTARFALHVDSGNSVANGVQARISCDPTGSGAYTRSETYNYFATDPFPGRETYTQASGLRSQTGAPVDLTGGCVKLEVWSAIGSSASTLRTSATAGEGAQSTVEIPYTVRAD
ncbi:hypothetical protein [Amycolatopsis magusensis]|uniref:Uncharacterized protein n=1 Tax=Amycolatopsis magusensis TaxID=882444 RepID=A0ABS4Q1L7_9PSEU|nr:hypothetical protein [Amycolatopsis magusensis]MBP2185488.1 hypothetical protein [Amycolatopsis magusensis]